MKEYVRLHKEVGDRNRKILTVVQKDIGAGIIVESHAPQIFGEPVVILQGVSSNVDADDTLYCLYISIKGPKARFENPEELTAGTKGNISGYLPFGEDGTNVYYEYMKMRASYVGRIYNEFIPKTGAVNNFNLSASGTL